MNLLEQIVKATVDGDEEQCVALAQQVLDLGLNPVEAIEEGYSKAMVIVGDLFSQMAYYLNLYLRLRYSPYCIDTME